MASLKIYQIEHKLGFASSRGMRSSDLRKSERWKSLEEDIWPIVDDYTKWTTAMIRKSAEFMASVQKVADTHGPRIWSDDLESRDRLLVRAEDNTHNGFYPKDLKWSDPFDQQIIIQNLRELVLHKVEKLRGSRNLRAKRDLANEAASESQEREKSRQDEAQRTTGSSRKDSRQDTPNQS